MIYCFVDASTYFFKQSYILAGREGGQRAAKEFTKVIAGHLSRSQIDTNRVGLSFWLTLYCSRRTLIRQFVAGSGCSLDQLDDFLAGFSSSSHRFLVVDVGEDHRDIIVSKVAGV